MIFALKSLISSLVGTVIKQHVFNSYKYTYNSAKASINIYAVGIFPPIPKICIQSTYFYLSVHFFVANNQNGKYLYFCVPKRPTIEHIYETSITADDHPAPLLLCL
jgi:hypothetical protein